MRIDLISWTHDGIVVMIEDGMIIGIFTQTCFNNGLLLFDVLSKSTKTNDICIKYIYKNIQYFDNDNIVCKCK